MGVVCPISVTFFFSLVLLLLLTQSLDMIDDEVSCLWVVCAALSHPNLLSSPYKITYESNTKEHFPLERRGNTLQLFTFDIKDVPGSRGSMPRLQSP